MKILDMFSGGGAAMGIHMALNDMSIQHEIIGIDIQIIGRYPFSRRQIDINCLGVDYLREFDFIWASPSCQKYSLLAYSTGKEYPDMIPLTRTKLQESGKPYVIENVENAPLRKDLVLCGKMFESLYNGKYFNPGIKVIYCNNILAGYKSNLM